MTQSLKVLKLTLATALAMTAISASTAQANLFEAESYGGKYMTFEHTTEHQMTIAGLTIKCSHITYNNGAPQKAVTSITLNPVFKGCKAKFGFVEEEVTVTGFGDVNEKEICWFEVDAHGTVDIGCNPKAKIEIHSKVCTVDISPQNDIEKLTYQNEGFGNTRDIRATFGLSNIKYTLTAAPNKLACEIATEGPYDTIREDFSYSGVSTVSSEENTSPYKPVGIWVNFTE